MSDGLSTRDVAVRTTLRPDYYGYFPNFSDAELKLRLARLTVPSATMLTPANLLALRRLEPVAWSAWRHEWLSMSCTEQREQLSVVLARLGISPRVVFAVRTVPREQFVRDDLRLVANVNGTIAFDNMSSLTPPGLVALMLDRLDPTSRRIVEIGAGAGYHAACATLALGHDARVWGVELSAEYADFGRSALRCSGFARAVTLVTDDGMTWTPPFSPDVTYVTAAHHNPYELPSIRVLKGGSQSQVVRPLTQREFDAEPSTSWLRSRFETYNCYHHGRWRDYCALETRIHRSQNDSSPASTLYDVSFVPLESSAEASSRHRFLAPAVSALLDHLREG